MAGISIKAVEDGKFEVKTTVEQVKGRIDVSTFVVPSEFDLEDLNKYITSVKLGDGPEVPGVVLRLNLLLAVSDKEHAAMASLELLASEIANMLR